MQPQIPGPKGTPNEGFRQAGYKFAIVIAISSSFLGTPIVYEHTVDWVTSYTAYNYSPAIADLVSVGWFGLVAMGLYYLAKMTLSTGFVMLTLVAAARFL